MNVSRLGKNALQQLRQLISPVSRKEDDARRERILLVILTFMASLSIIFTFSAILLATQLQTARQGISIALVTIVTLLFTICIWLVKKGNWKKAGVIFITTLAIPTLYSLARWGTLLPIPLLMLGLIILITGILFNIRSSILTAGIIGLFLGLVTYAHQHALLTVDNSWLSAPIYPNYTVEITVILFVITGLTTLAFSEIEASLKRARRSEVRLHKEIQKLDEKIIERSQALLKIEQLRIKELTRFAQIGKISAGILHDIVNPVTTLSLLTNHLKQLITPDNPARDSIIHLTNTIHRLEKTISLIKLEIGHDTDRQQVDITHILRQVIASISYSAHQADITIVTNLPGQAFTMCKPSLVYRALANICINAVEALTKTKRTKKVITITLAKHNNLQLLTIKDNANGMTRRQLRQIFIPFQSTKPDGHGIGLPIAHDILTQELNAQFTVKSRLGIGTTFFISW